MATVGDHDAHVGRAKSAQVLGELAGAAVVELHRSDLAGQHRRLTAGRGAEIERSIALLGSDSQPGKLRGGALRPDPAIRERPLVDPVDTPCARDLRIGHSIELAANETDHRRRRLVQRDA